LKLPARARGSDQGGACQILGLNAATLKGSPFFISREKE
jgi:hypothetical protein